VGVGAINEWCPSLIKYLPPVRLPPSYAPQRKTLYRVAPSRNAIFVFERLNSLFLKVRLGIGAKDGAFFLRELSKILHSLGL
jgi:hypothetical protein